MIDPTPRRLSMKLVLLLSVPVLLGAVLCAGGLMVYAQDRKMDAEPAYAYTPGPGLASARARINERDAARERARSAIGAALSAQSAALLAGDKAKFVGFAKPSAKRVAPWLTERFASLHAMGVARWNTSFASFQPWTGTRWQANIKVDYCFAAGCARPLTATLHTMWDLADEAHPQLTEMWEYTPGQASQPWVQSVLQARVGSRVVVAASSANAGRLDTTLAKAEAAARLADGYAGTSKPDRYVIYLASAREWNKWPYDVERKWVAGYATEKTQSVVINVPALRTIGLDVLLRHELTHVASLSGRSDRVKRADSWWLTEGLAEYAANGTSFSSFFRRPETVAFVRTRWNGDLRVGEPAGKASARDASARYGTAYLGVRCLMQKYGRAGTMRFVQAVAVQGSTVNAAAGPSLGASWKSVTSTCVAQIRRAAR